MIFIRETGASVAVEINTQRHIAGVGVRHKITDIVFRNVLIRIGIRFLLRLGRHHRQLERGLFLLRGDAVGVGEVDFQRVTDLYRGLDIAVRVVIPGATIPRCHDIAFAHHNVVNGNIFEHGIGFTGVQKRHATAITHTGHFGAAVGSAGVTDPCCFIRQPLYVHRAVAGVGDIPVDGHDGAYIPLAFARVRFGPEIYGEGGVGAFFRDFLDFICPGKNIGFANLLPCQGIISIDTE